MDKVSVIIPLYNKENCIGKTIDSVLCQTHEDFELIVVNDGSTDNSLDVVKKNNDKRIRIIDKQNEGVSATRNRGAEEAIADLLLFLDADDYLYPDCLEKLLSLREKYRDADLWCGNFIKRSGNIYKVALSKNLDGIIRNPHELIYRRLWSFRPGSFLISKKSFMETTGFPINISVGEDWLFMMDFCKTKKVAYSSDVVMSYVLDSRSLSKVNINPYKTVEWFMDFNDRNKWERLKFSENIFKRIMVSAMQKNFHAAAQFACKYKFWTLVGLYAVIRTYLDSLLRRV